MTDAEVDSLVTRAAVLTSEATNLLHISGCRSEAEAKTQEAGNIIRSLPPASRDSILSELQKWADTL